MKKTRSTLFLCAALAILPFSTGCGISTVWEIFGDKAHAKKEHTKAMEWYRDGTKYGQKDLNLYVKWCRSAIQIPNWGEAKGAVDAGLTKIPDNGDLLACYIQLYFAQAEATNKAEQKEEFAKKGKEQVAKIEKAAPNHPLGLYFSGRIYMLLADARLSVGELKESAALADKAVKYFEGYLKNWDEKDENPSSKEAVFLDLASLEVRDPQSHDKAEGFANKALASKDDNILAAGNGILGTIALAKGDTAKAGKFFETALGQNPDHLESNLGQAQILGADSANFDKTLKLYKKIIGTNPNALKAYIHAGSFLEKNQKWEDLQKLMTQAKDLTKRDQRVYMLLANALLGLGKVGPAKAGYQHVVTIGPESELGRAAAAKLATLK